MKQIAQSYRTGRRRVMNVPEDRVSSGMVGVRVANSLLSPGTERLTADRAAKSLIGKALERPDEARKVLEKIRRDGLWATARMVQNRLDAPMPLGYSVAGVVTESGDPEFLAGDRVACAGHGYASHAEFVVVPRNLCVRIPSGGRLVSFEEAAFTTVGAIALHAVRQTEVGIADRVAVIGLGLIGNLTAQILGASGCGVLGVDPDAGRRNRLTPFATTADPPGASDEARRWTGGVGVDAAIVAAASADSAPLTLAAELCRDRGRVVIVGSVPIAVSRDLLYRKEIELRLSRSYGPGRYDHSYEEGGNDYPIGYVRWTERRNMEAFLELLANGRVDVASLVTHRFGIDEAERAYELLLDKSEPSFGVLITYPAPATADGNTVPTRAPVILRPEHRDGIGVSFLGAGNFAQSVLLPLLSSVRSVSLRVVSTGHGLSARHVGERFSFQRCATDPRDVVDDERTNAVFVASPNDTHATYVNLAMAAGRSVFVEKPLCLSPEELREIEIHYAELAGRGGPPLLMVGFNRRFSPAAAALREHFASTDGPEAVVIRVNAGAPPQEGWGADRERAGSRIVGEACHFVDLLIFSFGRLPRSVQATRGQNPDDVIATLSFGEGRIGSVAYVTSGSQRLEKERVEAFGGGRSAVIDDFRQLTLFDRRRRKGGGMLARQDKGHRAEIQAFLDAVRSGGSSPIPFEEIRAVTRATFAIESALQTGATIDF